MVLLLGWDGVVWLMGWDGVVWLMGWDGVVSLLLSLGPLLRFRCAILLKRSETDRPLSRAQFLLVALQLTFAHCAFVLFLGCELCFEIADLRWVVVAPGVWWWWWWCAGMLGGVAPGVVCWNARAVGGVVRGAVEAARGGAVGARVLQCSAIQSAEATSAMRSASCCCNSSTRA